jgi:hypothetical protein
MTWFVLEKEREAEKFENKKIDLRVLEKILKICVSAEGGRRSAEKVRPKSAAEGGRKSAAEGGRKSAAEGGRKSAAEGGRESAAEKGAAEESPAEKVRPVALRKGLRALRACGVQNRGLRRRPITDTMLGSEAYFAEY